MTVMSDFRPSSNSLMALEDRFEIIREVGDGSFGSVALARVRANGASVARRGTMIAIKTMKKTFDSFTPCLELREVIFLKTLPSHTHLVPALDIFLDPYSKKLHIAMEYMDGNLYQLMKARDHKYLDCRSVKSILFQILSGLDHIHSHNFFHRDIKPENILVSTSAPHDSQSAFSRYSAFVTPPSTPPTYSIKIADFGLARETHSKLPYTTYVSTRWYRAPEVLLRAGEYSAPVDIWALGAMAVEVATLKPLFPGANEVDQVWRVCEIMGSPGNWYSKSGTRVGGGDWRDGTRLAHKLGFSFPKMAPHAMETVLPPPQWPVAFSNFVTWCLMWDPKNRPTSKQAMEHEFFNDAVDPLRPKSSSRLLGRKHSDLSFRSKDSPVDSPTLSSKASWFRRSLIARESSPVVPPAEVPAKAPVAESQPAIVGKARPQASKRATWAHGLQLSHAPMPILPSVKPASPVPNTVTAEAKTAFASSVEPKGVEQPPRQPEQNPPKIGRQLSINSHGNHYADVHRQEAERALNGNGSGLASPPYGQKESFFSHLRKRARRFSGRHGLASPTSDDVEASAAAVPWSNRSSIIVDSVIPESHGDFMALDKALQDVRYSLDKGEEPNQRPREQISPSGKLKRTHSLPRSQRADSQSASNTPVSSRTRRALHMSAVATQQYEPPAEEDELLDEALNSASQAAYHLQSQSAAIASSRHPLTRQDLNVSIPHYASNPVMSSAFMTPSPSAKRNGVSFGTYSHNSPSQPLNIKKRPDNELAPSHWPTPPYEESDWAKSAAASIFATGPGFR